MNNITFSVSQPVVDLGVKIITAHLTGIKNNQTSEPFELYKKKTLEEIKLSWQEKNLKDDPVLQGFRDLHTKVGRSNREYVASPEALLTRLLKTGIFSHINLLVDVYNLVSIQTRLALGAHDVSNITGNVSLKITSGTEIFFPLGKNEKEYIFPGEYGYVDDDNNVICRLEVLQCANTIVTEKTTDVFLIVQGNSNTTDDYVKSGAEKVCEEIIRYCGGSYTFL